MRPRPERLYRARPPASQRPGTTATARSRNPARIPQARARRLNAVRIEQQLALRGVEFKVDHAAGKVVHGIAQSAVLPVDESQTPVVLENVLQHARRCDRAPALPAPACSRANTAAPRANAARVAASSCDSRMRACVANRVAGFPGRRREVVDLAKQAADRGDPRRALRLVPGQDATWHELTHEQPGRGHGEHWCGREAGVTRDGEQRRLAFPVGAQASRLAAREPHEHRASRRVRTPAAVERAALDRPERRDRDLATVRMRAQQSADP